jgi:hypothetical protein
MQFINSSEEIPMFRREDDKRREEANAGPSTAWFAKGANHSAQDDTVFGVSGRRRMMTPFLGVWKRT